MSREETPQQFEAFEKEVHLSDYLNVLLRRWKIALLVFSLVFIGVAIKTFTTTPIYEAKSTLEVHGKQKGGLLAELEIGETGAIETEIQKLTSASLAARVITDLNLDWQVADASREHDFSVAGLQLEAAFDGLRIELVSSNTYRVTDLAGRELCRADGGTTCNFPGGSLKVDIASGREGQFVELEQQPLDVTLAAFANNLRVSEVGKMTNVIRVSYQHSNSSVARDVINQLVSGYLSQNVMARTQEAGKAVNFISQQLEGVRGKLDFSEQQLQEYKVETGLTTLGPEGNSLVQQMVELEQKAAALALKRDRVDFAIKALNDALRDGSDFTPPTLDEAPQIVTLATRLAELEAEKKSLLVDYTSSHPVVIEVLAEIKRVVETLLSRYQIVRQEILFSEQETAMTIAGYEEQLKDIPAAELELAKRMRVNAVNSELYTFLLQKQQEAQILEASTISAATVIDAAKTPRLPIKPNKKKNLALGLILGLMLGIGLVFLLDYMDQTIKTAEDVRDKLGLNVFGIIPRIPFADEDASLPSKRLVTSLAPKAPVVEAFRALRTNLNYTIAKQKHQVIMVTSSMPGEGKSTVAGNLAVVMSQTGAKVLLVGCDLRRPSLYAMFDIKNVPGLVDLLVNEDQAALRPIAKPRLDVMTAGTVPPNPAEILDSERFKKFLIMARERYDYVVIDAPPVLPVTDAQILAPLVDLCLVTLEPCRIPEKAAQHMVDLLKSVDAKIAGVILNDKSGKGFKYYGSYGYYGNKQYGGYYGETEQVKPAGPLVAGLKFVWGKLNS